MELLSEAKQLDVRTEKIGNHDCLRISDRNDWGTMTVWIDAGPSRRLRQWESTKERGNRRGDGRFGDDKNTANWESGAYLVENIQYETIDGFEIAVSCRVLGTAIANGGAKHEYTVEYKRTEINLRPDFSVDNPFVGDFDNGASITDGDSYERGAAFRWQDGKLTKVMSKNTTLNPRTGEAVPGPQGARDRQNARSVASAENPLVGHWKVVKLADMPVDQLAGATVVIDEHRVKMHVPSQKAPHPDWRYTLGANGDIDLVDADDVKGESIVRAKYSLQGNTLCLALNAKKGDSPRPESATGKVPQEGVQYIILESDEEAQSSEAAKAPDAGRGTREGHPQASEQSALSKTLKQLQGKWHLTRQIAADGDEEGTPGRSIWEFKGDRIIVRDGGPGGAMLIQVDESQSPVHVDLLIETDEESGLGLLSVEGDTLILCLGKSQNTPAPESRPEKLQWVSGVWYMELRRLKPGETIVPLKPKSQPQPQEALSPRASPVPPSRSPVADNPGTTSPYATTSELDQAPASKSGPVSDRVRAKLEALFQKHYPKAAFANRGVEGIHVEHEVTTFEFPATGGKGAKREAEKQQGPKKGGILCNVYSYPGRYRGQLHLSPAKEGQVAQHLIDRQEYKQLLMAPYSQKSDVHMWVALSYPLDTDEEFLKKFREIMADFEKVAE